MLQKSRRLDVVGVVEHELRVLRRGAGVVLAQLRTHAARLIASTLAVVIAVGFVVATLVLNETSRATVLDTVGARYVGSTAVVTSPGRGAARGGRRAAPLERLCLPVRVVALRNVVLVARRERNEVERRRSHDGLLPVIAHAKARAPRSGKLPPAVAAARLR